MLEFLKSFLEKHPRKIISCGELEQQAVSLMGELAWEQAGGYECFAVSVQALVTENILSPVKSSGYNGRVPPLAAKYRLKKKTGVTPPEIFSFQSAVDLSYFHSHPEDFYRYYEMLRAIDLYLVENAGKGPEVWDTVNERSLFLTGDEKFLLSAEGGKLLNKINITLEDLHCYKVAEPFFYRLLADNVHHAGEIYGLVIENKDTFETFSRLQGEGYLCLSPFPHIIIYGEGNKITRSWIFLETIPWIRGKAVRLFYFGDLDPEGINIFCRLQEAVDRYNIERKNGEVKALPAVKLELSKSL